MKESHLKFFCRKQSIGPSGTNVINGINIFLFDEIFIPFHIRDHWTAAIFDLAHQYIWYYDPLKELFVCSEFFHTLRKFIEI